MLSNCLIVVLATDKGSVINVNKKHRDRGADFGFIAFKERKLK